MTAYRPSDTHADKPPPATSTRWQYQIRTPLNLLIALMCSLAIAGIWLTTQQRITFEQRQAIDAALKSNSNLAIAFEQQIFRMLKAAEQIASFARTQYLLQGPSVDLRQWLGQHVIREALFTTVSVVDEHGDIVSSSRLEGQANYADREFFRIQSSIDTGDRLFVSRPVLGRLTGRWLIPMSLRISHPDGSFGGVVVLSTDPGDFTDFYQQGDLGAQGLLEFTGLDGIVRGRKIGTDNSFGVDASNLAWFRRQATAPNGRFVDDGQTADGVKRLVSYRTLANYPLMVTVGTAYDEEMAPVMQRRTLYLAMAAATTLALLLFSGALIIILTRQRATTDALQASEAVFRATFHQAAMGIAHIAADGRIQEANEKFCRMLGYTAQELRTRTIFDLGDPARHDETRQFMACRLSNQAPTLSPEIEKTYRRKDGSTLWVCEALGVVKGQHSRPDFLVAVTQDITARKDLETRLSHAAMHDPLTGLPNRMMFQDRLLRVLESASRHGRLAAVLYIDLDGFKEVNDTYGHATGDALLQQVARRLQDDIRAEDTASRFGGDEFGIVLATLTQTQDCERVAAKLIKSLARPFNIDETEIRISASLGAAIFPLHGQDLSALVAHADTAMYVAKHAGKNRYCLTIPSDSDAAGKT